CPLSRLLRCRARQPIPGTALPAIFARHNFRAERAALHQPGSIRWHLTSMSVLRMAALTKWLCTRSTGTTEAVLKRSTSPTRPPAPFLDGGTVSGFGNGLYLLGNISGSVKLTVTALSGNAVVSGMFFEPASAGGGGTESVTVTPPSATLSQGATQQFTANVTN